MQSKSPTHGQARIVTIPTLEQSDAIKVPTHGQARLVTIPTLEQSDAGQTLQVHYICRQNTDAVRIVTSANQPSKSWRYQAQLSINI